MYLLTIDRPVFAAISLPLADVDSAQCERFPQPGRADRWVDLSVNGFHSQATAKVAAIIALFVDCGGSAGVIRTSEEMCRLLSFMQCLLCAFFQWLRHRSSIVHHPSLPHVHLFQQEV